MNALDPFTQIRLESGAKHLHRLGPRATAEFLAEIAAQLGGLPAILLLLGEYETRLTPAMIQATGGDQFPPRQLHAVPR